MTGPAVTLRRVPDGAISCQERDLSDFDASRLRWVRGTAHGSRGTRADHDDGDVVVAAAVVREGDEPARRDVERALLHDVEDLGIVDEVRQAVAADDDGVVRLEVEPHAIGLDLLLEPD